MTTTDIVLTFSGDSSNINPDESLGGEPSVHAVIGGRLFSDIDKTQARTGKLDYRCFYFHNDHEDQALTDAVASIVYTQAGDSSIELGFQFLNDIQNITVTNANLIVSGYFAVTYTDSEEHIIIANWDSDIDAWAENLQTELRTIPFLEDVTATASLSGTTVIFEIIFAGISGNRFHQIMGVDNNLLPSGVNMAITKITNGSPINNSTDEIDVETTTPFNITFSPNSVELGDIRPGDSFPVWVKRLVPPNATPVADDDFTFRVQGTAGV